VGVGAATYAGVWTLRVLASPGLEVAGPMGWVRGALMVFAEGLAWGLFGALAWVLAPLYLVLRRRPRDTTPWRVALALAIFAPFWIFALQGRGIVDSVLFAVPVYLGVRAGLRGLAPEGAA
jgi:hypothetical protein